MKRTLLLIVCVLASISIQADKTEINKQNFPDENFRNFVLSTAIDRNQNKILDEDEILRVTNIDVHQKGIVSLKGIEYFTELQKLTCYQNNLTDLDLSACTKLDFLNCPWNKLVSLNLSNCAKLKWIRCDQNQLPELDVSACTELDTLVCSANKISTLDVSACTKLDYLNCQYINITKLDVSNNTELVTLYCDMNHLTELDLSKNTKLEVCTCSGNGMTKLILSKDNVLNYLGCSTNKLYGAAMEHIVENLNYQQQGGSLDVFNAENKDLERNVITTKQVEALNAKGWQVYQWIYSWYCLYTGIDVPDDSDYLPLVEESKQWHVVRSTSGPDHVYEVDFYLPSGIEEIYGNNYYKMKVNIKNTEFESYLLREEDRKIYIFDADRQEEYLMFDYSLKEGDTYETYSYEEQKMVTYKVLSVGDYTEGPQVKCYRNDEQANNGTTQYRYLRKWTVCRTDNEMLQKTWIEGVGSLEGPLANLYDERPISSVSYLAYVQYNENDYLYLPFTIYDEFGQVHGCNLPKGKEDYIEDWHHQLSYELEGDRLHVYGEVVLNCASKNNYAYFIEESTEDPLARKLHFEIDYVTAGELATCVSLFATDFYVPGSFDPNINYIVVDNYGEEHPVINKTQQMVYRPFVEEGKVWKVGSTTGIRDGIVKMVEYYYFEGDTIIDGKTCKQMMCQRYVNQDFAESNSISQNNSLNYAGAWYEEDKKVYAYNTSSKQFTLMYDFSLDDNATILIDNIPYEIGPRKTGGIKGFKGVYREVWECGDGESTYQCAPWLEGVGEVYGPPTTNVFNIELADPAWLLMSCTVGDEVIYLNDEYEDEATPEGAKKGRFDFTHTIKIQPKAPRREATNEAEALLVYGEYSEKQLCIKLGPLADAYQVSITDESGKTVYGKAVNALNIVALDIDISTYDEGRYTVTVENAQESFTGKFEVQTTGIKVLDKLTISQSDDFYDLQGRKLSNSKWSNGQIRKGIYVKNGRKFVVK